MGCDSRDIEKNTKKPVKKIDTPKPVKKSQAILVLSWCMNNMIKSRYHMKKDMSTTGNYKWIITQIFNAKIKSCKFIYTIKNQMIYHQ